MVFVSLLLPSCIENPCFNRFIFFHAYIFLFFFFQFIYLCIYLFAELKRVTIVSDSIAKYVTGIDGVHLQAFSGDTIARMANRVLSGQVNLDNYDYVLFHVGTNDVARKSDFESIISDYGNLIGICRRKKPNINIIISAILPRPVDHDRSDPIIRRINAYLNRTMCKSLNFKFIPTYRPFMYCGRVKRELFAKNDGGLHLNTEGTSRLRYFLRMIAAL